jgi:hypothetical protein
VRRIYCASSWRNPFYDPLVAALKLHGHQIYDWRRSGPNDSGFSWLTLDPTWRSWTPPPYAEALADQIADDAFCSDRDGIDWADTVILLLPAGNSAHTEFGDAVGKGKRTLILLPEGVPMGDSHGRWKPELMHAFADRMCTSEGELRAVLAHITSREVAQ